MQVVVVLVQGYPRAWNIGRLQPACQKCTLAISGRRRDKHQRSLKTLIEPVLRMLPVKMIPNNTGSVQLGV
ncbi:MAG: hypothetical protein U9N83_06995 [Thermodesulfobacteriota bacterium]|nr:hypothetical protein [Thermodesulfobacteriota bacterium]